MLKNLTLTLAVVALSTGCVIVDGSTGSDTNSATESGTDTDATATDTQGTGTDSQGTGTDSDSEGTGTDSDSEGTGTDTEGTTTDGPTTLGTTTDGETTTSETDSDTDSDTEGESDTEGALPCGWDPRDNYYACEAGGGVPGAEDPMRMAPYSCPGDLMAGAECGVVDNLGCCDDNGHNWYCIDDALIVEECS